MKVGILLKILSANHLPLKQGTAVALGNFDGVHIGHKKLMDELVFYAKMHGLFSCVYTFSHTPANILSGKIVSPRLTPDREKEKIITEMRVDGLYKEDFAAVWHLSPEEFVRDILKEKFKSRHLVVGFNFSFGKDGSGTAQTLTELAQKYGMTVSIIPPVIYGDVLVSSSYIRRLVEKGDMESAVLYLGRPLFIDMPVVEGRKIGHQIGVPTINQNFPEENVIPRKGVYACTCDIDGEPYIGISNIGVRPTVTGHFEGPVVCETHIFNYVGILYGRNVKVSFYKHLRDEMKFSSTMELKCTILRDMDAVRDYFNLYY